MNTTEKFTEFIKGRLSDESEKALFTDLSIDGALRSDFKTFASINRNIEQSKGTFVPSMDQKSSLFEKAGYVANGGSSAIAVPFYQKPLPMSLISSLASIIATVAVMLLFMNGNNNNTSKYSEMNNNNAETASAAIPESNSQALYNDDTQDTESTKETKTIVKYIYIEKESKHEETAKEEILNINSPKTDNFSFYNKIENKNQSSFEQIRQEDQYIPNNFSKIDLGSDFTLEIGSSSFWNSRQATVSPSEINQFNNLGIGLYYKPFNELEFGVSVKQETYYLEYEGSEPDGSYYKYMQQPNFTTFGANLRYYPIEFADFAPYAKLGFGMNRGGYAFQPGIGVIYKAYPDISFVLGFDYNSYWFSHQNNWFNTSKYGVFYGLNLRL